MIIALKFEGSWSKVYCFEAISYFQCLYCMLDIWKLSELSIWWPFNGHIFSALSIHSFYLYLWKYICYWNQFLHAYLNVHRLLGHRQGSECLSIFLMSAQAFREQRQKIYTLLIKLLPSCQKKKNQISWVTFVWLVDFYTAALFKHWSCKYV